MDNSASMIRTKKVEIVEEKFTDILVLNVTDEENQKKFEVLQQEYLKAKEQLENSKEYLKLQEIQDKIKKEFKPRNLHKLLLTSHSKMFEGSFTHNMIDNLTNTFNVNYEDPESVLPLVFSFIYQNEIECTSENVIGLYVFANRFEIIELKEKTQNFISLDINENNVFHYIKKCMIYEETREHLLEEDFLKKCQQLIGKHFSKFSSFPELFMELSHTVLYDIIEFYSPSLMSKQERFNISSVILNFLSKNELDDEISNNFLNFCDEINPNDAILCLEYSKNRKLSTLMLKCFDIISQHLTDLKDSICSFLDADEMIDFLNYELNVTSEFHVYLFVRNYLNNKKNLDLESVHNIIKLVKMEYLLKKEIEMVYSDGFTPDKTIIQILFNSPCFSSGNARKSYSKIYYAGEKVNVSFDRITKSLIGVEKFGDSTLSQSGTDFSVLNCKDKNQLFQYCFPYTKNFILSTITVVVNDPPTIDYLENFKIGLSLTNENSVLSFQNCEIYYSSEMIPKTHFEKDKKVTFSLKSPFIWENGSLIVQFSHLNQSYSSGGRLKICQQKSNNIFISTDSASTLETLLTTKDVNQFEESIYIEELDCSQQYEHKILNHWNIIV
jgi:hypothetical protein